MNHQSSSATSHPTIAQLQAYVAGRLDDPHQLREFEEHLRGCDECLLRLEQTDPDRLESQIRNLSEIEDVGLEPPPRYELIEEIGRGGAGIVYRAKQGGLDRQIALKMLLRGDRSNRAEYSRFRRESVALARLSHPHIVQVYDCGEMDGAPFIAMEYIEGMTLAERLQAGPLEARQAASWLRALADAIALVHDRGILHRDLKPQNVLLARGATLDRTKHSGTTSPVNPADESRAWPRKPRLRSGEPNTLSTKQDDHWIPKLVDFGLAVCHDSTLFQTATGETLGTPAYMAPEAINRSSQRTNEEALDIYGLGAILYECLTGRPPFTGSSTWEILEAVANRDPVSIATLRSGVPSDLITICNRCLDKRPERRFATARELADDLQRFLDGEPIRSRRISWWEKVFRWAKRRPAVATTGLLALALATTIPLLLAYQNWSVQQERNLAQTQYAAVRATLHEVLAELTRNTGTVIPEATQLAARQVAHARQMFQQLADVDQSPQSDFDLGKVLIQSAHIEKLLGQDAAALAFLDQATDRYARHQTIEKYQADALQGLFQIYLVRGNLLQELNQMNEAENQITLAAEIFESLKQLHQATEVPDEWQLVGMHQLLLQNLGTHALRKSKHEEAAHFYRQSLDLISQMGDSTINSPDHLLPQAGLTINLAAVKMQLHQNEAAESYYQQGLAALESWAEQNARTSKWVEDWSTAVLNRSNLLNSLERKEEAFISLDQARPILYQAIEQDPSRVELRKLLFMVSANRALFCQDSQRKIEVWRDVVADASERTQVTYARQILVRVLASHGQPQQAYQELLQIDSNHLSSQEQFVQASCFALIGKHLAESTDPSADPSSETRFQQSLSESWRLLQQLAEQNELSVVRREHLTTSDDWAAVRQKVGTLAWEKLIEL